MDAHGNFIFSSAMATSMIVTEQYDAYRRKQFEAGSLSFCSLRALPQHRRVWYAYSKQGESLPARNSESPHRIKR